MGTNKTLEMVSGFGFFLTTTPFSIFLVSFLTSFLTAGICTDFAGAGALGASDEVDPRGGGLLTTLFRAATALCVECQFIDQGRYIIRPTP